MVARQREDDGLKLMTEASVNLLETWSRPWFMLAAWNSYWGNQWSEWVRTIAARPAPWLPALAAERTGQPAAIDFFLPWMPDAATESRSSEISEQDAVKAMIRAATPHVGHPAPASASAKPAPAKRTRRRKNAGE